MFGLHACGRVPCTVGRNRGPGMVSRAGDYYGPRNPNLVPTRTQAWLRASPASWRAPRSTASSTLPPLRPSKTTRRSSRALSMRPSPSGRRLPCALRATSLLPCAHGRTRCSIGSTAPGKRPCARSMLTEAMPPQHGRADQSRSPTRPYKFKRRCMPWQHAKSERHTAPLEFIRPCWRARRPRRSAPHW